MRLAAGIAVISGGLARLGSAPSAALILLILLGMAAGILLLAGLWTPIAGALVAMLGFWNAWAGLGDLWAGVLLGALGAGLALLGPGAWSVDARLFGWKRIDVHDRRG